MNLLIWQIFLTLELIFTQAEQWDTIEIITWRFTNYLCLSQPRQQGPWPFPHAPLPQGRLSLHYSKSVGLWTRKQQVADTLDVLERYIHHIIECISMENISLHGISCKSSVLKCVRICPQRWRIYIYFKRYCTLNPT